MLQKTFGVLQKEFKKAAEIISVLINLGLKSHIDQNTYGVCHSTIHVIYYIYDIYDISDIYAIWHLTCIHMSIWMSKEALGPQECSQSFM